MKKILLIALTILSMTPAFAQVPAKEGKSVKWFTLQEAEKLNAQSPRTFFIDTFTDWCGWCKKMDKDTFENPVISDILNSQFYPVKFDAEGKESVTFMGKTFTNDGKYGKTHQLAVELLNGQLAYPTVVFLTVQKDGKIGISPVPGYKTPKEMEVLLSFFGQKAYETQTWDAFQQSFKGKVQ